MDSTNASNLTPSRTPLKLMRMGREGQEAIATEFWWLDSSDKGLGRAEKPNCKVGGIAKPLDMECRCKRAETRELAGGWNYLRSSTIFIPFSPLYSTGLLPLPLP